MSGGLVAAPPGAKRVSYGEALVLLAEPQQPLDQHGHELAPGAGDRQEGGRRLRAGLAGAAYGPILYSKTCISTLTPDRDFVIDRLPAYPQISLALGSGHAYKFAGLIGRVLSDLAVEGRTEHNIAPFAVDRPLLRMEHRPTNFLLRRPVRSTGTVPSPTGE